MATVPMDYHGDTTKEAAAPASKLNGADILFDDRAMPPRKTLTEKPAPIRQPTIGTARMLDDESIVLNLKARSKMGIEGEGELIYKPRDKNYQNILRHLSGLNRGEIKLVSPFDDAATNEKPEDKTPEKTPEKAPDKVPDKAPVQDVPRDNTGKDTPVDDPTKQPNKTPGDATTPTDKTPPVVPEQILPPSQQFLDTVNNTYNAMSKPVRDIIEKDGGKLVPARRLTDALPELKGEKPRGWPPGSTWDAVDGAYSPGKKLIVVAEDVEQTNGQWQKSNRTADVTRHEAGHAADAALNYYSGTADFAKAYDDDKVKISAPDQKQLAYFLQTGRSGPEETFAEGIASIEGGSTSGATFDRNFAATLIVIKNRVQPPKPAGTP